VIGADKSRVSDGPCIEFDEEEVPPASSGPIENSLRLLARLLARAATAPSTASSTDPDIPVDVAAAPKVGSEPE